MKDRESHDDWFVQSWRRERGANPTSARTHKSDGSLPHKRNSRSCKMKKQCKEARMVRKRPALISLPKSQTSSNLQGSDLHSSVADVPGIPSHFLDL